MKERKKERKRIFDFEASRALAPLFSDGPSLPHASEMDH